MITHGVHDHREVAAGAQAPHSLRGHPGEVVQSPGAEALAGGGGRTLRGAAGQAMTGLSRVKASVCFVLVSAAVATWLESLPSPVREEQVLAASTNLANLAHGQVLTLVASAFVRDGDAGMLPLVALGAFLASVEVLWSSRRLVAVFAAGHVLATLVVAAGLALGEGLRWLPSSWTSASDVGVSYGVVAVAGALTAEWPRLVRPAWALGWATVLTVALVQGRTFTDAGHLCALLIGIAAATAFPSRAHAHGRQAVLALVTGALAWSEGGPSRGWFLGPAAAVAAFVVLLLAGRWSERAARRPRGSSRPLERGDDALSGRPDGGRRGTGAEADGAQHAA